jgi:hypothetical protein
MAAAFSISVSEPEGKIQQVTLTVALKVGTQLTAAERAQAGDLLRDAFAVSKAAHLERVAARLAFLSDADVADIAATAAVKRAQLPWMDDVTPPRACWSIWRRLLTSWLGPLFRVRTASGAETDIGVVASTNLWDAAALALAVGAESWTIVTVYDQSGNGYHLTEETIANQPIGGVAGVAELLGGAPAADFNSPRRLQRPDSMLLSGPTALSLYVDVGIDTVSATRPLISLGSNVNGQTFMLNSNSSGNLVVSLMGASRTFTPATPLVTGRHKLVARIGAGQAVGTVRVQDNGVECGAASVTNANNLLTLGTAKTVLGSNLGLSLFADGRCREAGAWGADLTAEELAAVAA